MAPTLTPTTQKALLLEKPIGDLVVSSFPVPKPGKEEVLVKIHASALNPGDWKVWKSGQFISNFPAVLGFDIAGEVVDLGEGVTQFAIGDRVFYQGVFNENEHSGFQQYGTADVHTLGKIPTNYSYDDASSFPVAISAAYSGLYNAKPHGLGYVSPAVGGGKGKYANTPIVIIGGSSSVGQLAIQFAKISGFSPIVTTASLQHTEILKSLGASHVLDRNSPLTRQAIEAVTSKPIEVVFDTISIDETEDAGYNLLGTGGQIVVFNPLSPYVTAQKDTDQEKAAIFVQALKQLPQQGDILRELWANITSLLQEHDIKANLVEVVPGGLSGVVEGLKRLEENKVSKAKLVSHPQETA